MSSSQALEANIRPTHVYFNFKIISENRSVMTCILGWCFLTSRKPLTASITASFARNSLHWVWSPSHGLSHIWINNYCRSQIASANGSDSEPMVLTCGVLQGSILGLILFLCYVNDMPNCVDCVLLQYADDSALIVSDKDPIKIGQQLSKNLISCNKWLVDNKLSLHMGETELILFGTKCKLSKWKGYTNWSAFR